MADKKGSKIASEQRTFGINCMEFILIFEFKSENPLKNLNNATVFI